MKSIKTLIAATIVAAAAIGAAASANAAPLANPAQSVTNAIELNQAAKAGQATQVAFLRRHRCYRVPVYRWRPTRFGWRRVFVGFRRVCHRRGWRHGHRRGFGRRAGLHFHLSF